MRHTVLPSPVGPLVAVERDGGLARLTTLGPPPPPPPPSLLPSGALPTGPAAPVPAPATPPTALDPSLVGERDDDVLPELREQLTAYWDGGLRDFELPLTAPGTPFQQRVWAALRTIPFGETWSYAQLADRIGQPSAVRAVGAANGRNPVFVVVPCHRVVGSNGALVGYAGGLDVKRLLLDHERAALWAAPAR